MLRSIELRSFARSQGLASSWCRAGRARAIASGSAEPDSMMRAVVGDSSLIWLRSVAPSM